MRRYIPTADELRTAMLYDRASGVLTWKHRSNVPTWWNTKYAGKEVGCLLRGYVKLMFNKNVFSAHKLVWLYVTGEWPTADIDHINMNTSDNRMENLRLATKSQNAANRRVTRASKSKLKGVSWSKAADKWVGQICVDNNRLYLGVFDCPAAAHLAYVVASDKHFGVFARSR